jgi:serine protease inhibitor
VKKATDNLIDSIVSTSDINANTDLMLANAVYFKGEWLEPFNHFSQSGARSTGLTETLPRRSSW